MALTCKGLERLKKNYKKAKEDIKEYEATIKGMMIGQQEADKEYKKEIANLNTKLDKLRGECTDWIMKSNDLRIARNKAEEERSLLIIAISGKGRLR